MSFRDDKCWSGDGDVEQLIIIKCICNKPFLVSEIIDIKFKDVY